MNSGSKQNKPRRRQSISFGKVYEAMHIFSSNGNHNLTSLIPGEKVVLLKRGNRGWWLVGKLISPSDKGYVPSAYLRSCEAAQYMLEYFDMTVYGIKTKEEQERERRAAEEKAKAKAEEEAKAKAEEEAKAKSRRTEAKARQKKKRRRKEERIGTEEKSAGKSCKKRN